MMSLGSLALGNRYYNPEVPEVVNGVFTRYRMESRFIPGLYMDVFYEPSCNGDDDLIKHDFKVKLQADLWNNPAGCDQDNTGILSFICGSAS
jgi:hypothetical protein